MRLTDLLQTDKVITESRYKKLCFKGHPNTKVVTCSSDGWDFSENELTQAEVRRVVHEQRLIRAYEKKNGIESFTPLVAHIVNSRDGTRNDRQPEWPEELQPYKTDNILEAYFCHKFNIPCE